MKKQTFMQQYNSRVKRAHKIVNNWRNGEDMDEEKYALYELVAREHTIENCFFCYTIPAEKTLTGKPEKILMQQLPKKGRRYD